MNITCKICKIEFESDNYRLPYCEVCKPIFLKERKEKLHSKLYDKICKICDKKFKTKTFHEIYCSEECREEYYKDRKERTKQTNIKIYGTESHNQNKSVQEKKKKTWLKNLGFENPSNNPIIRDKISKSHTGKSKKEKKNINNKRIKTCRERYEADNYITSQIYRNKIMNEFGVEFYTQTKEWFRKTKTTNDKRYGGWGWASDIISKKFKETMIRLYGAESVAESDVLMERYFKSCVNFKEYKTPNGNIIKIQGYENKFLDEYFKNGGKEEDMIAHPKKEDIGKILYFTEDGKKHRYYPDFYIPKDNLIIEVKSSWTYDFHFKKNCLKERACKDAGYIFEFKIY